MCNALNVANAAGKHRPSFKMVSNMVIQLLHSIKYSVEVPFSNMAPQPPEIQKSQAKAKVSTMTTKLTALEQYVIEARVYMISRRVWRLIQTYKVGKHYAHEQDCHYLLRIDCHKHPQYASQGLQIRVGISPTTVLS